jgi:hypothetical protein
MYLPLQGRVELTPTLTAVTVVVAVIIASAWILATWLRKNPDVRKEFVMAGLASTALVPFILPRMHQRYFYPQDLISLVIVFFQPQLWFLPIISQIVSVLAYGPFLFNKSFQISLFGAKYSALLYVALPLEAILIAIVLWKQFRESRENAEQATTVGTVTKTLEQNVPNN